MHLFHLMKQQQKFHVHCYKKGNDTLNLLQSVRLASEGSIYYIPRQRQRYSLTSCNGSSHYLFTPSVIYLLADSHMDRRYSLSRATSSCIRIHLMMEQTHLVVASILEPASNSRGSSTGRSRCVMFLGKIVTLRVPFSTHEYNSYLLTGNSAKG